MERKNIVFSEENCNKFTIKCILVTALIFYGTWILNLLNIFIIDSSIYTIATIGTTIITIISLLIYFLLDLKKKYAKYVLLFIAVILYSFITSCLTYHTMISLIFPLIYSAQYRKKKVIWYTYGISSIGILLSVVLGYYYGLCDANMILYTSSTTRDFIDNCNTRNIFYKQPDWFSNILFFVVPKTLVMLGVVPIVSHLNNIIDNKLNELVVTQEKNLALTKEFIDTQQKTIVSLATIIEGRDQITGDHIKNTANYVKFIIEKLNENNILNDELTKEYSQLIIDVAPLHDIGKVKIPDSILCKNGKLTDEEYKEMKKHPEYGYEMLNKFVSTQNNQEYLDVAKDICLYHHERYDGLGYPKGLKKTEIPLSARIMAVADVLDALLSKRQYKEAFSFEKTYSILENESGKQFDPIILSQLLNNWEEFKNDVYLKP